jgi:hypothetical protein
MRKRDRDRAEALRLAGGGKPSLSARAVALARERGVVRTCDLSGIGNHTKIRRFFEVSNLTRSHGRCPKGERLRMGYP